NGMAERLDDIEDRLQRFKDAFAMDIASGDVRRVEDYLVDFPGLGDQIAIEFANWTRSSAIKEGFIGPYRIDRELGRGGQAIVYLCDDERLKRKVAVKVLLGLGGASAETLARFRREAEVTSRLEHPGICALYETGVDHSGAPWIAMRHIEGRTLSAILAESRGAETLTDSFLDDFSVTMDREDHGSDRAVADAQQGSSHTDQQGLWRLLECFEKVARTLHVAHESGIVHRDIKPGNIMVGKDGEPVVLDFGLASADADVQVTQSGDLMGTPAYMSPEQVTGGSRHLDRRTDVWSLGVTLHECLSGRRPFAAPSREALYRDILIHEPEDLRRLSPTIPVELSVVLQTAMNKDAERRYATAENFADDLRRVRERKPIAAQPMSAWLRTCRWAQRNPIVATMSAALLLFLGAGIVWTTMKNRQLATKTVEAEDNAGVARRNEDLANESAAEAKRNLQVAERLADVKKLSEAKGELDELWPLGRALPARILAFRLRYEAMIARLPLHEKTLADLEGKALPYSVEDQEADHLVSRTRLAVVKKRIAEIDATLEGLDDTEFDAAERELESLEADRASLEVVLSVRRTWRFGGEDAGYKSWMHDVLVRLVHDLGEFADPRTGALAGLSEREARSHELVRKTVTEAASTWARCQERLRSSARYAGFTLPVQEGLIPLGPDADSGLEEFLHWSSHDSSQPLPMRDSQGRLPAMSGKTGNILVLIPGGTFTMGAELDPTQPNHDPDAGPEEGPQHRVTLSAFFIGKFELTRGQWVRMSGREDPSNWTQEKTSGLVAPSDYARHPVDMVSWLDCRKVLTDNALILPTEAQWEYSCRAGSTTRWSFGDESAAFPTHANCADESYAKGFGSAAGPHESGLDDTFEVTAPVGSLQPNAFGLHDLHGNLWEWCRDEFGFYDRPHAPGDGLLSPNGTGRRASRGGSFFNPVTLARATYRSGPAEKLVNSSVGARVARFVQP
ncbi:MAG: SUMF1/EgtB/PvdO family nonheme iron enzyme, partial [Planctomycetes bacterium]|nr:SUMF1/EgtB/PvdO family nonheme iron enzyme [Planctomycetota bacterium]